MRPSTGRPSPGSTGLISPSRLPTSTLVVHGEEDISIEIGAAEATVEIIPNAELVVILSAGHSSNLKNPEAANSAIREFLDGVY